MCTVTLIPVQKDDFILTSNRDEAINRKTLPPEFYKEDGTRMLFPKDAVAGGTWIGVSDKDTMICLLNGGFKNHTKITSYTKSRGVVVKDLLASDAIVASMEDYDFSGIEPCTIVMVNWTAALLMYELVWDGKQKHLRALERTTHIWSSSTLYTEPMKAKRKEWFTHFEEENELTPETVLDFHKNAGIGDIDVDLQIDRGVLKTRSITQICKVETAVSMRHEALQNKEVHTIIFEAITV